MYTHLLFRILVCIFSLQIINGYRILGVFPHAGKSHFFVFAPIMRELAKRGHDVTIISQFPNKNPIVNYTDIIIGDKHERVGFVNLNKFKNRIFGDISDMLDLSLMGLADCELLGLPQIQKFVENKPKFDVIIQELFNSDCFLALNYVFNAPMIGISSSSLMPWYYNRLGIPLLTSYVPINLLPYSEQMNFGQRVYNTIAKYLFKDIFYEHLITKPSNEIVRKHLGTNIPDLNEVAKNISLLLINTHYSLNRPKPLPPNVIEISSVHIANTEKLPNDLEQFTANAQHGVIYFCLGSLVKGSTLNEEQRNIFLDVFAQLPQRVLWKYENESLPNQPANVMIRKWLPQNDILNHPNVKAFISHGGLLGTIEAVNAGVPVIVIPLFGDQFVNAQCLKQAGIATILDLSTLTKEKLITAMQFVLNEKIQTNAKLLSKNFKDRPISAMESAIWWIEYVARNGHESKQLLQPYIVQMNSIQSSLLDVYCLFLVLILVFIFCIYKCSQYILTKLFFKSNKLKKE